MVSLPPPVTGELFYDGVWNAASVRTTSDVEITRGLSSESTTAAEPMTCICDLNSGKNMLYAPQNPLSPLYGKIGRNTPFRLGVNAGGPYLSCPDGVYTMSTPNQSAFQVSGDLDIRVDVKLEKWFSANSYMFAQRLSGSNVNYAFAMDSGGTLYLWWTDAGSSTTKFAVATNFTWFASGERACLRATLDVDNGASGWTVRFWYAKSLDAADWTMIGDPVTGSGVTSLPTISGSIHIADAVITNLPDASDTINSFQGEMYGFQLWDGINDQLRVDLDIARDGKAAAVGGTSFVDATGWTWTRNGVATLENLYYRAVGEIPAWPPTRDLTGADIFTSIAPTGITRRMDAGNKPIDSAILRLIKTSFGVTECWPMTDPVGDTQNFAVSLVGGANLTWMSTAGDTAPEFGNKVLADWIEPGTLVKASSGAEFIGPLPIPDLSKTSGKWAFDVALTTGGNVAALNNWVFSDNGAGTTASPRTEVNIALIGSTGMFSCTWAQYTTGASSTGLFFANTAPANNITFFDVTKVHHVRMEVTWSASSMTLDLYADAFPVNSGTVGIGLKPVNRFYMVAADLGGGQDQGLAYCTYWEDSNFIPGSGNVYSALRGNVGEQVGDRLIRIGGESDYTTSISGVSEEDVTLSEQDMVKLLQLYQDASDANFGYFLERRDALEVYHRAQTTLWNQAPIFTLDFQAGIIGAPFKPVDDDLLTENDITVSRSRNGSPYRDVLSSGALSVQDPPNGVSRYDKAYKYIMLSDDDVQDAAAFKLRQGTYGGVRYTRITIDCANKRAYQIIHKILRIDVGDKIRLINIPLDHGVGPVDVLVQGYSENIGPTDWSITFNCIPGDPWTGAMVVLDGETNTMSWMDTGGTITGAAATSSASTMTLFTTGEFHWTDDLSDTPYDLSIAGEDITVLGPAGPMNPNSLTDTDASSWTGVGSNCTVTWDGTVVHPNPRAKGSIKVVPTGGFTSCSANSPLSGVGTVTPGVSYSMGFWVYSPLGFANFYAAVDWYDSSGTYISTSAVATPTAAAARTWTWVPSLNQIAPALSSQYVVRVRAGGSPASTDIYYAWAGRATRSVSSQVRDTFTRTLSSSWGTSETGHAWTNNGGTASDFATTGSGGTLTLTSTNVSRTSVVVPTYVDQDVRVNASVSAVAVGASIYAGLVLRYVDANNLYYARLAFNVGNTMTLVIQSRVGGVQTDLATVTLPYTYAINQVFGIRFQANGTDLRARAWPIATSTEPRIWHAEIGDFGLRAAGVGIGVKTISGTANTNTNPVITYDNFETVKSQSFVVLRAQNGIAKSHAVGEDVDLASDAYVQM